MQKERSEPAGVTRLLLDWRDGDAEALGKLTPIVYQELRRLAHRYMRQEPADHVLQTTALVHEAYMRLVGEETRPPPCSACRTPPSSAS